MVDMEECGRTRTFCICSIANSLPQRFRGCMPCRKKELFTKKNSLAATNTRGDMAPQKV